MRLRILLLASLLGSLAPMSSRAQSRVNVDPRALDPLSGQPSAPPQAAAPGAAPTVRDKQAAKPDARRRGETARGARDAASEGANPPPEAAHGTRHAEIYGPPRPPAASLPAGAPPLPVIPPPIEVPTRPAPPPEPAPAVADAPGRASPLSDGLRLTFGAERTDMNQASEAALRALARETPPAQSVTYTVTAFAAPQPDDPSTPRRLALSRALAVRSILIAQGVPSPQIIVKVAPIGAVVAASGTLPPTDTSPANAAPPDRVDITRTVRPDPPPTVRAAAPAPAPATPAAGLKR